MEEIRRSRGSRDGDLAYRELSLRRLPSENQEALNYTGPLRDSLCPNGQFPGEKQGLASGGEGPCY